MKNVLFITCLCLMSNVFFAQEISGDWATTIDGCKVFIPDIKGDVFEDIKVGLKKQKITIKWTGDCAEGYVNGIGALLFLKRKKIYAKYEGPIYNGKYLIKDKKEASSLESPSTGDSVFVQLFFIGKGKHFKAYYRGWTKDYKMHGLGELLKINGTNYSGGFKDGLYEGYGELAEKDGVLYKGTFTLGQFDGKGYLLAKNGTHYIGEFRDGAINGFGKMNYALSHTSYEGEWYNDYYHGNGKFIFETGDYLVARFRKSLPLYGVYYWDNGDKYYGELDRNWEFEGQGVIFYGDSTKFECGKWKSDQMIKKLSIGEVSDYLRNLDGVMFDKLVEKI